MEDELLNFIKKIQSNRQLISFDEAATKQAVILPILSCLGWDTSNIDEVHPEYSIFGKKVDYALINNNYNKEFIEVKKVGEDLEKHQEQLLNYSFQKGVKLAILTNGITWWFYLPLLEGSWEQRKFYTVEVYDQSGEEITQKFIDFLSKENVSSGKAVENAENIYKSKQRQEIIKETIPKAWNKLIEEPDEALIGLIAETTEKLCGYKPEDTTVEHFVLSKIQKIEQPPLKVSIDTSPQPTMILKSYTNKSIRSFVLKGTKYNVNSWKEMLIVLCDVMLTTHRNQFEQILKLRGRKKPYFTKNLNELRAPEKINGTDIFVEVNLSANNIVKLSIDIISVFGYTKNDLIIDVQ